MPFSERRYSPEPERYKRHSAEDVYLNILGLKNIEELKSPEDFPSELDVPAWFLGDMETLLSASLDDEKERGQLVFWDAKENAAANSKVFEGKREDMGWEHSVERIVKSTFSKERILNEYHLHPYWDLNPSPADLAFFCSSPRIYNHMIGNSYGVVLFMKTEAALKLPVSATERFFKLKKEFESAKVENMEYEELGELCAKHGLVMYLTEAPSDDQTWQKGELGSDLKFRKVA